MNLLLFVLIPLFRYKHCIYNIQWVILFILDMIAYYNQQSNF